LVLTGDSQIGGLLGICSCGTGLLEIRGGSFTADEVNISGGTLAVTQGGEVTASKFLIFDDSTLAATGGGRLTASDLLAVVNGTLRIDGTGSVATVVGDTAVVGLLGTGVL